MSAQRQTVPSIERSRIAWIRDPAGMSRDERNAELVQIFAIGLNRFQNLQNSLEHQLDSEPSCADAPVNHGARRVAR